LIDQSKQKNEFQRANQLTNQPTTHHLPHPRKFRLANLWWIALVLAALGALKARGALKGKAA
jgi:hypothetical protein